MNANEIDWSKSPNGEATHYCKCVNGYSEHWMKAGHFSVVGFENMGWERDSHPAPLEIYEPRYNVWVGQGLPPVGTKCLYSLCLDGNTENPCWFECEIHYVIEDTKYQCGGVVALCKTCPSDIEQFLAVETTLFKPIAVKSKADMDKEKAISTILEDVTSIWASSDVELAEALYEKGYHK